MADNTSSSGQLYPVITKFSILFKIAHKNINSILKPIKCINSKLWLNQNCVEQIYAYMDALCTHNSGQHFKDHGCFC